MADSQKILARLPSTRNVVRIYGIGAKKTLSQNFLHNTRTADRIIAQMQPGRRAPDFSESLVLEVGPGPGLLTRSLVRAKAHNLIVVERDSRFLPILNQLADAQSGNMEVVLGDALEYRLAKLLALRTSPDQPVHIVGNLPFNIASPLLITYLRDLAEHLATSPAVGAASLTLMFQKEVAERIVAVVPQPRKPRVESGAEISSPLEKLHNNPSEAAKASIRSRLSVAVQALCDAELCLHVPAAQFRPQPKVDAAVVRLTPRSVPLLVPGLESFKRLNDVARQCFACRSKTIVSNLAFRFSRPETEEILRRADVPRHLRPSEIETEMYVNLAQVIHEMNLSAVLGGQRTPRPRT